MVEASIGVNLRVTAHSNQGGRKYMEDMFCVAYQPTADDRDLLYAYFGIFDGHGGREAALNAKHHLMDQIVQQKNFWSEDDDLVLKAIKDGFLSTHYAMWKELEKWPRTPSGLPSTSGTTASIAFVRRGKLYIGHVGDSGIVMGFEDPETGFWRAKPLTKDHKPESPVETNRIIDAGGKVIVKSGVPRVVWNRPRIGHRGPVRRSTLIDEIPFLAVARSLGDLWSYNSEQNEFVVSPEPDVSVIDIDVHSHRCLILGTDGLWNMLTPQDAVNSVYFAEKNNERQPQPTQGMDPMLSKSWINPSKRLVDRALDRWLQHGLRADNTSVVTVVVDPPGPPKDPTASPVGISRYVPHKSVATCVSTSPQKDSAPVPCSSSTILQPAKLPAVSKQPRGVIPKAASTAHSVKTSTARSSVAKCTRRSDRTKGSSPTSTSKLESEAASSVRELDTMAVQPPQTVSASTRVSGRSWGHRSPPVAHIETSQNSSQDAVQIHEISSSSESTKSDAHNSLITARGKRKVARENIISKKPRYEKRVAPSTRKTASPTLPVTCPVSSRPRLRNSRQDPHTSKSPIKSAPASAKTKGSPVSSPQSRSSQRREQSNQSNRHEVKQMGRERQRIPRTTKTKKASPSLSIISQYEKLQENKRSLRSSSRSMVRILRKI